MQSGATKQRTTFDLYRAKGGHMLSKVFISYSRKDIDTARAVCDALTNAGVPCFLDESSIDPGTPFPEEIAKAIRACSAVVVILSTNVLSSSWVESEVREARFGKKWLVPYRIDHSTACPSTLPSHLQEIRCIDRLVRAVAPKARIKDISATEVTQLEVPGLKGLYSSFHPATNQDGAMLRLRMATTSGWIPNIDHPQYTPKPVEQKVYLIRDPVRPFEIQIGEIRSLRPGGIPGAIELDPNVYNRDYLLGTWRQLVRHADETTWERAVLAEVAPDPDLLKEMYDSETDKWIRGLIGKNPAAPDKLKQQECLFCNPDFVNLRSRTLNGGGTNLPAVIINNDYPFGPHFHYIVFPGKPIHSWDAVQVEHLLAMNFALFNFLSDSKNLHGAAGLRVGFNSSVRHLVAGARTRASAGASISHIHKQAWGMANGSFNLGDHLAQICETYKQKRDIDYLGCYLNTLRQAHMVIAEDDFVALYVPLGQIAAHELQIMVKRPTRTFLDLNHDELKSLSFAELAIAKLYAALGINSYNEVVLSQAFDAPADTTFRLIFAFVTREVDLAVSELSMLFVTDKHPYDTVVSVNQYWAKIVEDNSLPYRVTSDPEA